MRRVHPAHSAVVRPFEEPRLSRRTLLLRGGAATLALAALRTRLLGGAGLAAADEPPVARFGPLRRDPNGLFDLPEGFSYRVVSRTGETMSDGFRVPGAPDGMAAFPGPGGKTILVRNHELTHVPPDLGPFGTANDLLDRVARDLVYDRGGGTEPALGGTTTVVWDTAAGKVERQYLSLAGTLRNCAGGPTPWGSWVSCEESLQTRDGSFERVHGFNFEVPATAQGPVAPEPLRAMGRFNHEAVAFDPASGCVYQTEDRDDGLFYRFLPNDRRRLAAGGRLQALKACECKEGIDLRNWSGRAAVVGELIPAEWVDLDDVESPADDLRMRGFARGATRFARGEGMWRGSDGIYFACTSGGARRKGQIFRYVPSPREGTADERPDPGMLELFAEPNDAARLDMGDNLTVAPWGELVVCEDGPGEQYLRLVDARGEVHTLARNAHNESELAGVTFSPDGSTMFVNIMFPGITLAVTGPWPTARA